MSGQEIISGSTDIKEIHHFHVKFSLNYFDVENIKEEKKGVSSNSNYRVEVEI